MFSLAVRNFTARKWRSLSTALAVFFGVAMIAGTLMLTDSVDRSFDQLFSEVNAGIDVTVRPHVEVEGEFGSGQQFARPLDESMLDEVRAVDGVAKADGVIGDPSITIVDENGERVGPMGPPHLAVSPVDEPFESFTPGEGRSPESDDEVMIDTYTAEKEGYEVGDTIRITGRPGEREYTISGIGEFGSGAPLGGASLVQFTLAEAQRVTGKEGKLDEIDVAAEEGVTPEALAATLREALPASVDVRTGAETATEDAQHIQDGFGFLSTALLVFAGISVFVGAFLIFNTFSITIAQRTREIAMLRTLGASSRQMLTGVIVEAVLVGLLASALGIAGGFGFVELVKGLFKSAGFELPSSGLVIQASTVVIAVAVGLLTTLAAALSPALRATRVAPLEALVETGGGQTAALEARSRRRTIASVVLIAAALILLPVGLFLTTEVGTTLPILGAALVVLFIGIAMVGDRFVPALASAIAWPIERLRGVTGKLARENSQRQPGRTAITAAALMIGVALVVFVGVFAASIQSSLADNLDRQFAGDVAIVATDGFSPLPSAITDEVEEMDGVETVSALSYLPARLDPQRRDFFATGIDSDTIGEVASLDWAEGSDAVLAELGEGGAVVDENFAEDEGLAVGDEVQVVGPSGDSVALTVQGITKRSRFIVDTLALDRGVLRDELGAQDDTTIFVNFADGADPAAVRTEIDTLLAEEFPSAEARNQEEYKQDREEELNQLIALIYVLLGLSVLVSLFGVINTLSLTILERTRELGMLRAIGTSRRQVRQMIRYESIVTALLGALVGAVIGLGLGAAAVIALADEGLELTIPVTLPIVVLVTAIALGIVAAVTPARRASRVDIIRALQYE